MIHLFRESDELEEYAVLTVTEDEVVIEVMGEVLRYCRCQ